MSPRSLEGAGVEARRDPVPPHFPHHLLGCGAAPIQWPGLAPPIDRGHDGLPSWVHWIVTTMDAVANFLRRTRPGSISAHAADWSVRDASPTCMAARPMHDRTGSIHLGWEYQSEKVQGRGWLAGWLAGQAGGCSVVKGPVLEAVYGVTDRIIVYSLCLSLSLSLSPISFP